MLLGFHLGVVVSRVVLGQGALEMRVPMKSISSHGRWLWIGDLRQDDLLAS